MEDGRHFKNRFWL